MSKTAKPTRADVARLAGVAESTVSRALNDSSLISAEVTARVKEAALQLGYVPSRQAAMFARNQSGSIGLVVPRYKSFPPFSRAYFPAVLDGVVVAAERLGYFVTIILDRHDTTAEALAQLVVEKSVDGLLFTVSPAEYTRYEYLTGLNLPFVLINNYHDQMCSVDSLPEPGMRKAFEHAVTIGHRRIGYVTGDTRFKNGQDRLSVFRALSAEFDLTSEIVQGDFSRTSGFAGSEQLLRGETPPSLIMTASDRAALGVLSFCKENEIHVPGEVSVIGYDNLHTARDASTPLSTVSNPIEESGAVATELLVDLIEGSRESPYQRWPDTGFVIRQSTVGSS